MCEIDGFVCEESMKEIIEYDEVEVLVNMEVSVFVDKEVGVFVDKEVDVFDIEGIEKNYGGDKDKFMENEIKLVEESDI